MGHVQAVSRRVHALVALAILTAQAEEPHAGPAGWVAWARDVIPPDVLADLPPGYLVRLAHQANEADDDPTEELPRPRAPVH